MLPKNYLGGHVGVYPVLDMESRPDLFSGDLFSVKEGNILKFQGFNVPPYVNLAANPKFEGQNDTFTVYGAIYSIIYEIAKKANFT